ncbi:hypothetical protein V6N13_069910 [Hibiscus sabdariffa]|uniref:Transmembrane protein n=1 Tax=Hibiscus sabdariffa TaxID=183260 RepID=A0ABR2BIY5_9ROSI
MLQERQGSGASHGVILAVVVFIVVLAPFITGDQGEAITEAISELLTPLGLLLLPLLLLLAIQSYPPTAATLSPPANQTPYTVSVAPLSASASFFSSYVLFLLYYRASIFGGGDDSDD